MQERNGFTAANRQEKHERIHRSMNLSSVSKIRQREGESLMTQRRGTAIKQGAVADVMSRLSELPNRDKDPGAALSLSEVFRTKEYIAEIKGALKKGYTFENLAEIFTERCGVAVSARQLKYHYTREKNRKAKNSTGGKLSPHAVSKSDDRPENSARINPNAEIISAVAGMPPFGNRPQIG
jgi:hypothetical protein